MWILWLFVLTSLSTCRTRDSAADVTATAQPYMVSATMELLKPIDPSALQTSWQSATKVSETAQTVTYRITVNPLVDFQKDLKADPNWRSGNRQDSTLRPYLVPGLTTNWDEKMRADLFSLLKASGINPETLTDLELVQKVSTWLFTGNQFTYKSLFIPYYVAFQNGKPVVLDSTRPAFDQETKKAQITSDEEAIALGMLGKSIFDARRRGDCTASAILQATVLKALGIPTRIVVSVPIADANNPAELAMVQSNIHHPETRKILSEYLIATKGYWANHTFNEVYVGKQWVRLNYNRLAQPLVDKTYLGLMVQVARVSDWSHAGLETWGMHQVQRRGQGFSVNPYRTTSIQDR